MTPNVETRVQKITRKLENRLVIFDGHDNKRHTAFIEKVRRGVARIRYSAGFGQQSVTAYVTDPLRLWWRS